MGIFIHIEISIFAPMTPHTWPYKAKNCKIHDPKSLKNQFDGSWVAFLAKKGRGVATVVCV